MNEIRRDFKPHETIPRMAADFAIVHLCMIFALTVEMAYELISTPQVPAVKVLSETAVYYWLCFWPLSVLFPVLFLISGFYTRSRSYTMRHKTFVLLRGTAVSLLAFLAANFLVFRHDLVSRSALLSFTCLLMTAIVSARLLKSLVTEQFEITKREPLPVSVRQRSVLVVGGAGYIGSRFVRKMLDAGYKVRVLDSLVYGDGAIRDILGHHNLELQIGDCRNIQNVVAAVKGMESIVHLAAIVGDPACEQDKQSALEVNYSATRMLVQIAKGNGIKRFVFASSCSVYGATDVMMDESSAVEPVSLYGQTKVDSEGALLQARSNDFHPVLLRFATVFGLSHRPRFDLVVNLLTAKAIKEGVITIFNGEQWRPFIHVDDVAEALVTCVKAPIPIVSGQVFNVGDNRLNFTLTQIADKIRTAFPLTKVEQVENADRRNYRVSFDKIRTQLGFQCAYTIEDGVEEIRRAFTSGLIEDYTDAQYNNQKFLRLAGPSYQDEIDVKVMAAFANVPHREPTQQPSPDLKRAAAGR